MSATLSGPSTNWQFTGEQRDADSSLYYLRARYYDPATGRFLSRDPIMAAEADDLGRARSSGVPDRDHPRHVVANAVD